MSLLQSLFTDKKQTNQLHTAFTEGMQQAKQHLWEAALPNFMIAVDLAHSYVKAQVCFAFVTAIRWMRNHSKFTCATCKKRIIGWLKRSADFQAPPGTLPGYQ